MITSMKVQIESGKLINQCSYSFKVICIFWFIQAGATSSKTTKCPFQYLYHFGDGITDIGNSIRVLRYGRLNPAAKFPYGSTYPGSPTGRWSDGRIDFDYAAADFGLPRIVPYLSIRASTNYDEVISSVARSPVHDFATDFGVPHITSYFPVNASVSSDGVIFSVARSPVLDRSFFEKKGVIIPSYAVSLYDQLTWFKSYLKSICSTPTDCANRLRKSLMLMGDIEGNDMGYPLTQGKSIKQVKTYVPSVIRVIIKATKELIKMGATRIVIPGNAPLGCYPYILTALQTNDSTAYDNLGCLKNVNDLISFKNDLLKNRTEDLQREFPNVTILYGNFSKGVIDVLRQASSGPNRTRALKACCGIGGKYNYDSTRFCGSPGVPICPDPNQYIFWDGLYFTQEAYARIEHILIQPALAALNCTSQSSSSR